VGRSGIGQTKPAVRPAAMTITASQIKTPIAAARCRKRMPMPDDNERHYHQGRGGRPDRHQNEAQQEAKQDLHAFDPL